MRTRNAFLTASILIVVLLQIITDPDSGIISGLPIGANLLITITLFSWGFMGLWLLHVARKALNDYDPADFMVLGTIAKKTHEGAGLMAIAVAIKSLAYAIVIAAALIGSLVTI